MMSSCTSLLAVAIGTLTAQAFTSPHVIPRHRSALHAKRPNRGRRYDTPNKGFGKRPAPLDINKSYDQTITPQSHQDAEVAMHQFFTTYSDWHPLFLDVMSNPSAKAHMHLLPHANQEEIWSTPSNPWKILPEKPESQSKLSTMSHFLDEWQKSLENIPMDAFKNVEGGYDLHFLEEGRRTIAVTRFHVMNTSDAGASATKEGEWESQLFEMCWSELGHLMNQNENDTGSLILLPSDMIVSSEISLERVQEFVGEKLIRPIEWLGRGEDWEIVAMERGVVGVRLLYKLGEIPDLSEKYQMED